MLKGPRRISMFPRKLTTGKKKCKNIYRKYSAANEVRLAVSGIQSKITRRVRACVRVGAHAHTHTHTHTDTHTHRMYFSHLVTLL